MLMTFQFHLNTLICRPYNSGGSIHLSKRSHTLMLYEIEPDVGFTRAERLHALGHLTQQALGSVQHGEVLGERPS
jgi:hypothetical protein